MASYLRPFQLIGLSIVLNYEGMPSESKVGIPSVLVLSFVEVCYSRQVEGDEFYVRSFERTAVERPMNEASTDVPMEFRSAERTPEAALCSNCPQCLQCHRKFRNASLPEELIMNDDAMIVYSIAGDNVQEGFAHYIKEAIENDFYRWGMKPLKLWTSGCALVISFMQGAFPLCNCNRIPENFQMFMNDIDRLFKNSSDGWPCAQTSATCVVSFLPDPHSGYYVVTNKTDTLLKPSNAKDDVLYMQVPSFKLEISTERVLHPDRGISETFFAVSRQEIVTLVTDIAKHHTEPSHHFTDLERFLISKIEGRNDFCFTFGPQPRRFRNFDEFLGLDKTK